MPRVINFDRGSKRRIRAIRWTQRELASALILFLLLALVMLMMALWDAGQFPGLDLPQKHQVQQASR